MGHSFGILVGAEDGDAVGGGPEGFDAFEGLLAVVDAGGEAVHAEVGVGDKYGGSPFAGLDTVGGFDMAVDWAGG